MDAYRSCTLPPSAKFRVQNARLTSCRDGSGESLLTGETGKMERRKMAGRCLTEEAGGEERKGSELEGNKVSLIPSLFFRQSSFLMEIVCRGFLCNFSPFPFLFLLVFLSFLYYYRLPISFASGISLYKSGRNWLEATCSERKRNFFYVNESVVKQP